MGMARQKVTDQLQQPVLNRLGCVVKTTSSAGVMLWSAVKMKSWLSIKLMWDSQRRRTGRKSEAKLAVASEASTKCFEYTVEENDVLCALVQSGNVDRRLRCLCVLCGVYVVVKERAKLRSQVMVWME